MDAIKKFIDFYGAVDGIHCDRLSDVYDKNIEFTDPIHRLKGIDALREYYVKSFAAPEYCRFTFSQQLIGQKQASLCWQMAYAHKKINHGQEVVVNGISYLAFDDKITLHRDYYDLGEMIYEHLPILGFVTNKLKNKLAS